jgi:hypothetical protein
MEPGVGLEPTTPSLPSTSTRGKADHKGTRLAHVCPAKQPRSWSGSVPGVTVCLRPDVSVLCPRKPSATDVEAPDDKLTLSHSRARRRHISADRRA